MNKFLKPRLKWKNICIFESIIIFVLIIALVSNCFASSDIIYARTKDEGEIVTDYDISDYSPLAEYELKSYPIMVCKNGTYYCFTNDDKKTHQLYGKQKVDIYQDGSVIEPRYFNDTNGKLLTNTVTKDGFWLDDKGKIIEVMGCALDHTTPGFKFLKTQSTFTYRDKDGQYPSSTWAAISPLRDNIYYWYYFDSAGQLATSSSKVQGKYTVDKDGRYMEGKEVVSFYLADNEVINDEYLPEFVDTAGLKQDALVITPKDTVGVQGVANATIYATVTKMQQFLRYVNTASAVKCDFDILDRNFWDSNDDDNKGIIKNAIQMQGKSSSFSFTCSRYNSLKIKYAIDTTNGLRVDSYTNRDDITAVFKVMIDGEEVWYDDNLIKTSNPVVVAELETEKEISSSSKITFLYETNNNTFNLNITVDTMKKIKYKEDE